MTDPRLLAHRLSLRLILSAISPATWLHRRSNARPVAAVVVVEPFLIGLIYGRGRIVCRAVFDLLTVDIEVHQSVRPVDLSHRARRDQDFLSGPPVPGIDGDISDAPAGIVHEEVLEMTEHAVGGMNMVPGDL